MKFKKINILKSFLGTPLRSSSELLFYCPKCKHHKKKLSVNIEKNKFKCWICDYKGNDVSRLVRRWGTPSDQKEWPGFINTQAREDLLDIILGKEKQEENVRVELPKEFRTLVSNQDSLVNAQARNYLTSRNVSKEDIFKYKIGYCSFGQWRDRIIFPSFDKNGKLNYFIGRTYGDSFRKYMLPVANKDIIFNELLIDWDYDVVLTEGVFDCINAENSIPILGSTLRKDSRLFAKIVKESPEVYMALDPDAEKKSQKIIDLFLRYGIMVYKIDLDPYEDLGSMSKEEFVERKLRARLYTDRLSILETKLNML